MPFHRFARRVRAIRRGVARRASTAAGGQERARHAFFARENAAWQALRADPVAWNAMLRECATIDPLSVHESDFL